MITWINASAGSGKTYYIIQKIKEIKQSNTNKSKSILCLSYSNAAASEMSERVDSESRKNTSFHTVHSFCNLALKDKSISVINEKESEALINKAVDISLKSNKFLEVVSSFYDESNSLFQSVYEAIKKNIEFKKEFLTKEFPEWNGIKIDKKIIDSLSDGGKLEINLMNSLLYEKCHMGGAPIKSLLTDSGQIRKRLYSSAWKIRNPFSAYFIDEYCIKVFEYVQKKKTFDAYQKSVAITSWVNCIKDNYENLKKESSVLDFNDLINNGIKFISESIYSDNIDVLGLDYIFVDEAQDLSEKQWEFIYALFVKVFNSNPNVKLYVVGDSKQSIYGFQGSSVYVYEGMYKKMQYFAEENKIKFATEVLNKSYRTSPVLLDYIDSTISSTSCKSKHSPVHEFSGRVEIHEYESEKATYGWNIKKANESEYLNKCLRKVIDLQGCNLFSENRGISFNDIMVLTRRRNSELFKFVEMCKSNNIPVKKSLFKFGSEEIVQELVSILKFAIYNDDFSLASILKGPFFKWAERDLLEVCSRRKGSIFDSLNKKNDKHSKVIKTCSRWKKLSFNPVDFYGNLLFSDEYGKFLLQSSFYEIVIEFWNKVVEFTKNNIGSPMMFIEWINGLSESFCSKGEGISISTIHGSKGLESKIVILLLNDSDIKKQKIIFQDGMMVWPVDNPLYMTSKNQRMFDENLENERLLYVALTRPVEQLYIFVKKGSSAFYSDIIMSSSREFKNDNGVLYSGSELTKRNKDCIPV
ncbi:UvrD-helicase domain-containing protein [Candidatus Nesciobacter abundans]|uniref:DNA 3'-5' helicase n=1 Tax=Candidatus Nesciobacter abundans TaxID=2601668 RepID=A0A5C0UFT8_9PROT|nr:UvrD-helicase domain-containing protein [Candidatus Nesciobacter abundans]QEK38966.1 AAA family ATPase [Candidatus Nesciobacter abundans]